MKAREALGLIGFLGAVFLVAALGSLATAGEVGDWYAALEKPAWTPPGWVFGPVWTVLYLLIAVAGWLVWRRAGWRGAPVALGLFCLQLSLNGAWSPVFFGLHEIGWGLAIVAGLWVAVLATILAFWRVTALAGALLIPYQVWITFAAALNFALWRLNT
jgi:tryptophan-rich sensory protein